MNEGTEGKTSQKSNTEKELVSKKPKLTWAQRLAAMDPEEAAALRAKANEASKRSKAKKRGLTPAAATIQRLEAQLEKIEAQQTELNAKRQQAGEALEEARAEFKAEQAAEATESNDSPAPKKTRQGKASVVQPESKDSSEVGDEDAG